MLQFFTVVFGVLGVFGAVYWRWRSKVAVEISEGAEIEWAHFQQHEPDFLNGMEEATFREVYWRVHQPRFPGYVLAILITFFLSLPVTLGALSLIKSVGVWLGVIPKPLEVVRGVALGDVKVTQAWECTVECQLYIAEAFGGFYYFFGVVIVWLITVLVFMRRFHARRPGYLRDELIRARP